MELERPASAVMQISAAVRAGIEIVHEPELRTCGDELADGAVEMCLHHVSMHVSCRSCYDRHNRLRHVQTGQFLCGLCGRLFAQPARWIKHIYPYAPPEPVVAKTGSGWPVEIKLVRMWAVLCQTHDELLAYDVRDVLGLGVENN